MALQSQTYANSGNAYYIQGGVPNNPSTMTALNGPVEILLTSSIKAPYYGELNQSLSTFTISENNSSNLKRINFLTMNPVTQVTQMGINDINNPFPIEPVIQQWSLTSSIVNGVFKVGTKQLNNEPNALSIINNAQTSIIQQNDAIQVLDGANNRIRFQNFNQPLKYTEIDTSTGFAGTLKCANDGIGGVFSDIILDSEEIRFRNNGVIYGRSGVNNIAPNQYYMTARTSINFVTDDTNQVFTPLKLRQDGNIDVLSTMNVPSIYNETAIQTPKIIQLFGTAGTPINVEGSFSLTTDASVYALPGFNYVEAPRIRVKGTPSFPKTYFSPGNSESQIIQNTLIATAGAPASAFNSMEFIQNSGDTVGGFQFYHGTDGSLALPQWLGGFTNNPKQFILASTMTASLPFITDTQTASIQVLNNTTINTSNIFNTNLNSQSAIINVLNVSTASISTITTRTINGSTASLPELTNVSSINALPITSYGVPTGTVLPWAGGLWSQGASIPVPNGFLLCDGREFVVATNPQLAGLYAVIGKTYGGGIAPERFNIPHSYGKALMGAVNSSYQVEVTAQALVTVNLPTGGTRVGLYINQIATGVGGGRILDGQIYSGMIPAVSSGIGGGSVQKIIGSAISNDGVLSNNRFRVPFVLLLQADATYAGAFPYSFLLQTINPVGNETETYFPCTGNDNRAPGSGYNYMTQQTEQVGTHTHGSVATSSSANSGAANQRSEPNFSSPNNVGTYSYTDPGGTGIVAPSAHMIMPLNMGLNMIIKF